MEKKGVYRKFIGLNDFKAFVEELHKVIKAEPLFRRIGRAIRDEAILDRFISTKEDPDGKPWVDLSPAYKKQKEKLKGTIDLLVKEGELQKSVGFKTNDIMLVIGAGNENIKYARRMQAGDDDANIPARAYIGFGDLEKEIVRVETQNWLMEIIK